MPSLLQSDTARRNGAKSHGPKTEAGKSRSRLNGLKHGLRAKTLILPGEDTEAFESRKAGFIHRFQPADETTTVLVNQLVATSWRLERFITIETHLLGIAIIDAQEYIEDHFDVVDDDDRLAIAYKQACEHPSLIHLHRQINLLHRQFERILQALLQTCPQTIPQNETSEPGDALSANPINNIPNLRTNPEPSPTSPTHRE